MRDNLPPYEEAQCPDERVVLHHGSPDETAHPENHKRKLVEYFSRRRMELQTKRDLQLKALKVKKKEGDRRRRREIHGAADILSACAGASLWSTVDLTAALGRKYRRESKEAMEAEAKAVHAAFDSEMELLVGEYSELGGVYVEFLGLYDSGK